MKCFELVILVIVMHIRCFDSAPFVESESSTDLDEASIRLPANTRPINYDIELSVNIQDFEPYTGSVTITIVVDEATDVITLHSKSLQVQTVKVLNEAREEIPCSHSLDATKDFLLVTIEDASLVVGAKYVLEISFSGYISSAQSGFYRTSYRDIASDETR
jgi:Peptidase M1 N-terminal domain